MSVCGRFLLFAGIEVSIGSICFPNCLNGSGDSAGAKVQVVLVEDLSHQSGQSGLGSIIVAQYPLLQSNMFCSSGVGEWDCGVEVELDGSMKVFAIASWP